MFSIRKENGGNPVLYDCQNGKILYLKNSGYTKQDAEPTPDNPIDIKGLGDNGTIEVKTTGKNLFNKNVNVGKSSNTTYSDGIVSMDMSAQIDTYIRFKEAIKKVVANTTYTLSFSCSGLGTSDNVRFKVMIHDESFGLYQIKNGRNEIVFTPSKDAIDVGLLLDDKKRVSTNTIKLCDFQIEVGTEATLYQAYTETTASIPTDAPLYEGDYIEIYADGSGKEYRKMKEIVLDGFNLKLTGTDSFRENGCNYAYLWQKDMLLLDKQVLSTIGIGEISPDKEGVYTNNRNTTISIILSDERTGVTSEDTKTERIAKFNTWLQSNNVTVVYELAEPIITPLTAEQVAEFMKLQTFKPVTHVTADGEVDVTYKGTVSKELINADDTQKKFILSFPNSDIDDITNSQIYSESMSLEESLIEQSDIKFGKCNASVFKIRVANIDANLEGLDLSVSITFSNASLGLEQNIPIGVYKIRTAERSADRKWKDIVAYDYMTKFDVDIADWYNTVAFPTDDTKVLCKTLIAMLCDYVGVSYDANYNFTFGDLEISKNILPTSLSGRDFLQQLLEFNCCFGHFNELGVLSFIDIEYDYAEYVYPSDDIFPSDDFLGGIQGMRADEVISLYKSCNFEEYQVIQPNSVAIKMEDDSIGVIVGSELGDRTYRVIGNSCLYGLSANELRTVATKMLNRLEQFYYTPNVTEVKGGLFLTLGSAYQVTHKFGNFQSYVFRRTIKGIQALYSTLESNAVEYATETSNIITEMSVIKGKTAKVKRDIDSLTVEYQDFTEQTRTQFEQSAEQFSWLVADNFSESNVMLSADAYTAIANNIVLQGNHIILDGDTTVTEGFTLSADNLDVNSIFAQNITATGTITGVELVGASGNFTEGFSVNIIDSASYQRSILDASGEAIEMFLRDANGYDSSGLLMSTDDVYFWSGGRLRLQGKNIKITSDVLEVVVDIINTYGDMVINADDITLNGIFSPSKLFITGLGGVDANSWNPSSSKLYLESFANASTNGARAQIGFHNSGMNAATFYLDSGFRYCDNGGNHYTFTATSTSDRRKKNDYGIVSDYEANAILDNIDIHSFTYINDDTQTIRYGAMAQDVRDFLIYSGIGYRPFLEIQNFMYGFDNTPVLSNDLYLPEENVSYNIDYTQFIPILIKGWQMHEKKIKELLDKINELLGGNENA